MADTFLQRNGSYPYLSGEPSLIKDMDTHQPYSYYTGRTLNYPIITSIPELLEAVEPTPFLIYRQNEDTNNGYPFLDLPNIFNGIKPIPYMMYGQNEDINDGYPFLDLPDFAEGMTKPLPYLYIKDNQMDYTEFNVTIPEYKFTIRVPEYKAMLQNEIE